MRRSDIWSTEDLLGNRVRNSAGEDLGRIEDFVVDPGTGRILYAVLSFGGFPGMGDRLFAIPWAVLNTSPGLDHAVLNVDKAILERAPGFERNHWPDMADPVWQARVNEYYGGTRRVIHERTIYADRAVPAPKKEISVLGLVVLALFLMGVVWTTFLVATRGADQAWNDIRSSFSGAAYAMKETSKDAALTAKVKTALSLSKRIPADRISVESENDVVTLRGEVASQETRNLAESITRDTQGVAEVQDYIFVTDRSK